MINSIYDHGFGIKWKEVYVEKRERYKTSVTDFHEHNFYEINLVLSGNIKAVVADRTAYGTDCKIILTRPNVPHYVICKPDILYSSLFLVFTEDFIKSYDIQCTRLLSVFGDKGAIFTLSPQQRDVLEKTIYEIGDESNVLRKKFLVYYLLSHIDDLSKGQHYTGKIPPSVYDALTYIDNHYTEKIVAAHLAKQLHIGRTTLMTQFKKHTGKTLHEYIVNCRLRNAIKLLSNGKTESEVAEQSGFSDTSSLIQCFKRVFGVTPGEYIKKGM